MCDTQNYQKLSLENVRKFLQNLLGHIILYTRYKWRITRIRLAVYKETNNTPKSIKSRTATLCHVHIICIVNFQSKAVTLFEKYKIDLHLRCSTYLLA